MTPAQARMLSEVHAKGEKVYNGRARRTVEALEAAGYVTVERDSIPQSKGSGIELVERLTVKPKRTSLGRRTISVDGPGWAVVGYDDEVLPGRWATQDDAREHGLCGKYLLSGVLIRKVRS